MTQLRTFGNYRFSPHQAAALVLVSTGSVPQRRLHLNALNAFNVLGLEPGLERKQWRRILDRLCDLQLIESKSFACSTCSHEGPTYGLTEHGVTLYASHRQGINQYAEETLPHP